MVGVRGGHSMYWGLTGLLQWMAGENDMTIRMCRDYSYFNLGISFGYIINELVLTINVGFWSIEVSK